MPAAAVLEVRVSSMLCECWDVMLPPVLQDLRDSGCVSKTIRWGVELVANVSWSPLCISSVVLAVTLLDCILYNNHAVLPYVCAIPWPCFHFWQWR